jgi:hypothetical protein
MEVFNTAEEVADTLGRKAIAEAAGVGVTAVSNAVVRDKRFPSSWFVVLSELAAIKGRKIPPELCGMRGTSDRRSQSVDNVKRK